MKYEPCFVRRRTDNNIDIFNKLNGMETKLNGIDDGAQKGINVLRATYSDVMMHKLPGCAIDYSHLGRGNDFTSIILDYEPEGATYGIVWRRGGYWRRWNLYVNPGENWSDDRLKINEINIQNGLEVI